MNEVYLVDGQRTPFGSFGGSLSTISAPKLASEAIKGLLARLKLEREVDEVILGQVLSGGVAQAPARQAMRAAGLSDSVPAMTINKVCGSGLKAMMLAAGSILLGESSMVLAGGMESMSQAPFALPELRFGKKFGHGQILDLMLHDALTDPYSGKSMGEIAENSVQAFGIRRSDQDDYALASYEKSLAAIASGRLAHEITPIEVGKRGKTQLVSEDEEPFKLKKDRVRDLKPAFLESGTITAANASTINDGAAVCLVASLKALKEQNLTPLAKIKAAASYSDHPDLFAHAPIGAIEKLLKQTGLRANQIDLFEINEAFSAVPLIATRVLSLDETKVNPNGGAVSLGHPVGASGARLALTLGYEIKLKNARYGICALCIGGGEAVAMLMEGV